MSIEEKAKVIRCMITAIIIAEYQLVKLVDGTKQDLKVRVKNAINSCRRVQDYFITHNDASRQTSEIFKQQFLGDEIVLLSELLETCFGMSADGIEQVIEAVKQDI